MVQENFFSEEGDNPFPNRGYEGNYELIYKST